MRRQMRAQCFRFSGDLAKLKRACVRRAFVNRLAQLLLRRVAKARQFSYTPLFTRFLQLLDRADAELIVKSFDLFRAQAGQ